MPDAKKIACVSLVALSRRCEQTTGQYCNLPRHCFGWEIYLVCEAVATIGPGLPSTNLYIRIVVKAIDRPTLFATASISMVSPTCAVPMYVTWMSMLAPVFSRPWVAIASPPLQSTSVALTAPWIVPLELTWFLPSVRRDLTVPLVADIISHSESRKSWTTSESILLD